VTPQRDAALAYAEAGALVLPIHTPTPTGCSCRSRTCTSVGKHPRVLHGVHDATSDVETVERWWSMWPDANIGRVPAADEVVLDIDPRNGGYEQLTAITTRFGKLPRTWSTVTGSGGWHLSYRYKGPVRGQLAPGIDLKTCTGYVLMPPSLHGSGGRYEWLRALLPVAPMPGFLIPYIQPPATKPRRSSGPGATPKRAAGLLRVVTDAREGERNRRLYWACRRAAEHGIDPNPLVEAAVAGGLPRGEAERTCVSAFTASEVTAP
jgi:hypothetical protein